MLAMLKYLGILFIKVRAYPGLFFVDFRPFNIAIKI